MNAVNRHDLTVGEKTKPRVGQRFSRAPHERERLVTHKISPQMAAERKTEWRKEND